MIQNILVGIAGAAVAALLLVGFLGTKAGPQGLQGEQGIQGPQGAQGIPGPAGAQGPRGFSGADGHAFGAVSSPDIQGNYYSVGGQVRYRYHIALNPTASTSCSIRAPREGTSTLVFASVKVASSSSAATIWEFGKDNSGPDATTTLIGTKYNLAANTLVTLNASTSPQAADANVFAPGAWLAVKIGAPAAGGISGTCNAEWVVN